MLLENPLNNMVSSLCHRGPNMSDTYIDVEAGVALGHNRLSIIDLSRSGMQPMSNRDNSLVICYNGEIYNYIELKKELLKSCYSFKSKTDTEVILYGYQEWGMEVFSKLNGMWGLVIYDKRNNKIIVSRDRIGIKPVYYYHDGAKLVIASEIKAILGSKLVKAEVNFNGLGEYFTFQNIISNDTLFKDIYMLEAGHNMEFDLAANKIYFHQYWDMSYKSGQKINEQEFCEEIRYTFNKASNMSLIGDVPIGATISGGMDSSSIMAIVSQRRKGINTFTGYFDDSHIDLHERSINERADARIISNLFDTSHHERLITANNVIDTLPAIVWHLEDPKVGMCYTFYLINQLISQYVTVNLSGTGGDEIFGGYPWRYQLISDVVGYEKFCEVYYKYWSRLIGDEQRHDFFTKQTLKRMGAKAPLLAFKNITDKQADLSPINLAIYFELKTFLHGMLLVEDKMGMAYSIETRFPFLDNNMVELTSRIPDHYKYSSNEAKLLLKKAFKELLPKEILYKRKQGFTPPDMSWYRKDLRGYIKQLLLGPRSIIGEYVNGAYINRVLEEHRRGADHRLLIWSLMFFEGWLRVFVDGGGCSLRQF